MRHLVHLEDTSAHYAVLNVLRQETAALGVNTYLNVQKFLLTTCLNISPPELPRFLQLVGSYFLSFRGLNQCCSAFCLSNSPLHTFFIPVITEVRVRLAAMRSSKRTTCKMKNLTPTGCFLALATAQLAHNRCSPPSADRVY